jgi:hypothetical protein
VERDNPKVLLLLRHSHSDLKACIRAGELRTARYHSALGSMRESFSCLEVAHAFGYVRALDNVMLNRVNRITGSLVRLVKGKR